MKTLLFVLLLLVETAGATEIINLTTQNTINFRGVVDDSSVITAQLKLAELAKARGKANYTIYLVLDSPGGSLVAGDSFIQFAKTIPNVQTITLFAASMAAGIVEALPGKRNIAENGILMFHRARAGFQGQFEMGEVESQLALAKALVLSMENVNAARLGLSLADYKVKVMIEYWLYGAGAVKDNAADTLINIVCSSELIDARELVVTRELFGQQELAQFSSCPLLRSPIEAKEKVK